MAAMGLRTTILWIHALSGAAWVAACGCFVIVGLALESGGAEQRNFVARVAPKIDGLIITAAALLLVSGGVNFAMAGEARGFRFSQAFLIVLGAKTVIFLAMVAALAAAMRIEKVARADLARGETAAVSGAMEKMVRYHGAVAALGGVALLLGLWLMGS
jgi:hypothetical protein